MHAWRNEEEMFVHMGNERGAKAYWKKKKSAIGGYPQSQFWVMDSKK